MSDKVEVKDADVFHNDDPDMWEVTRKLANAAGGIVGMTCDPQSYAVDEEYWKQFFLWPPWCFLLKAS